GCSSVPGSSAGLAGGALVGDGGQLGAVAGHGGLAPERTGDAGQVGAGVEVLVAEALATVGGVERHRLVLGGVGADVPVLRHARPGGDELADDDVLLQAEQR